MESSVASSQAATPSAAARSASSTPRLGQPREDRQGHAAEVEGEVGVIPAWTVAASAAPRIRRLRSFEGSCSDCPSERRIRVSRQRLRAAAPQRVSSFSASFVFGSRLEYDLRNRVDLPDRGDVLAQRLRPRLLSGRVVDVEKERALDPNRDRRLVVVIGGTRNAGRVRTEEFLERVAGSLQLRERRAV